MRSLVIVLVSLFILSCNEGLGTGSSVGWPIKVLETKALQRLDLNDISSSAIENINVDYQQNPAFVPYSELILYYAFFNISSNQTTLVFGIVGVDDIQAVYVIRQDGQVLEKYLYSLWQEIPLKIASTTPQ